MSSKLLWFGSTRILYEQFSVVFQEQVLDLSLSCLVHIFLIKCNDTSGDSLTNSVDLGYISSTLDLDSDVNLAELLLSNE